MSSKVAAAPARQVGSQHPVAPTVAASPIANGSRRQLVAARFGPHWVAMKEVRYGLTGLGLIRAAPAWQSVLRRHRWPMTQPRRTQKSPRLPRQVRPPVRQIASAVTQLLPLDADSGQRRRNRAAAAELLNIADDVAHEDQFSAIRRQSGQGQRFSASLATANHRGVGGDDYIVRVTVTASPSTESEVRTNQSRE